MNLTRENLLAKTHKLGKYPLLMSTKYEITKMNLIVSLHRHQTPPKPTAVLTVISFSEPYAFRIHTVLTLYVLRLTTIIKGKVGKGVRAQTHNVRGTQGLFNTENNT